MSRILCLSGAAALSAALLAPQAARADNLPLPAGSYQQTCSHMFAEQMSDGRKLVNALCRKKSGGESYNVLDYRPCAPGSIANDNGDLKCAIDPVKVQAAAIEDEAAAAAPNFKAASMLILGYDPAPEQILKWVQRAQTYPSNLRGYMLPDLKAKTVTLNETLDYLKAYLMFAPTPEQQAVATRAMTHVWGGPIIVQKPSKDWLKSVKAGNDWYATIVLAEQQVKANQPKAPPAPQPTSTAPLPPIH